MKKVRSLLSRLFLLALFAGLLCAVPAHAADIKYDIPGGSLTFDPATGTVKKVAASVVDAVIPAEIMGVPVTSIGEYAFFYTAGASKLERVTLPDSITSIGAWAFYDCPNLVSVTIPDSVTKVGSDLFNTCSRLQQVKIGRGLTAIQTKMFQGCSSLTSFDIPDHITAIGAFAFDGCSNLKTVTIPNSVTSIGSYAFKDTGLVSVTIPDSVTKIGESMFMYCSSLASVKLPNGITEIPYGMFDRCFALDNVIIPNGVTIIGNSSFDHCSGLKSISIPASVTGIYGFYDCKNLTDVYYGSDLAHWAQIKGTGVGDAAIHFSEPVAGFSDVMSGDYYAQAVKWAKDGGVTGGTSETTFSPADPVTRGQAMTFLWAASGRPEPASASSPFTDVADPGAYYYKAVLWAKEKGITSGVSADRFGVGDTLHYDQFLAFLCRVAGGELSGDWSQAAVSWAGANGLTSGVSVTAGNDCPRSDVVYFLWKQLG